MDTTSGTTEPEPQAEPVEQAAPAAEGKDWLSEHDSEPDEDAEAPVEPTEEPAAPAQPTTTEQPDAETTAEGQEGPVEATPPERTAEYGQALAALKRYGLDESDIEGWSEQKVIDKGLKLAKIQTDYDGLNRDVRALKARKDEEKPETQRGESTEPSSQPDLKAVLSTFAEQFGDEAAKALESVLTVTTTPLAQRLEQAEKFVLETKANEERAVVGASRRRLEDRFPELADEATFDRVTKKMRVLAADEDYHSNGSLDKAVDRLMEDASRLVGLADRGAAERRERLKEVDRARSAGQPTVPKGRTPTRALSADERTDAYLDELEKKHGVG
jgi:hypothetical protein